MHPNFDQVDLSILSILQADASLTAADVAKRVGLSQSPCWRRISRLEKMGLIQSRVALLDRKMLGFKVTVFVEVKCARGVRKSLEKFEAAIAGFPEVQEAHMLMGDKDILLKVVTLDVEAFEHFIREKLSVLPAVLEVRSFMALSTIKSGVSLPLDLLQPVAR